MALKLAIEKLEDVEEGLRPLYAEKDGKFALQVDGLEDTSGLRSALGKERHARAELEKKIKKWESIGKTDEEIAELLAKNEEHQQSEAERKGEWDKLKAQMNEKHAADLKKKEAELATEREEKSRLRDAMQNRLIDGEVIAAIAANNGYAELLRDVVRRHVKVEDENGEPSLVVVDAKGEKRFNGKGDPLPLTEMVAELKAHEIYAHAFKGTGASGGGTTPGNGSGGSPQIKRRSDLKNREERVAFVEKFGNEAYLKLPY